MPERLPRLFVALPLPPAVEAEIAALPRPERAGVRWTRPDRWHITLRFLGACEVDVATDALARVNAVAPTVTLGPAVSRLGRTVVCVPVGGAGELAAAVEDVTADIGRRPDTREFRGHITIARLSNRDTRGLTGASITTSFEADHIELVESTLTADGPIYETRFDMPLISPSSSA